jgi:diguanylate cyclase (GGDEF)-like protein
MRPLRFAAVLLLSAGWLLQAAAVPPAVVGARELAGRDPQEARRALAKLRDAATASRDLATRLFADEADCRVLSDSSAADGRAVVDAGVAAAASAPALDAAARLALLRLRACGAGILLDLGEQDRGTAEVEAVLAASSQDPGLAEAHALALLERGLHRSRRNDLVNGQSDLLAACHALEGMNLPQDLELCRSHLANHYKRMGDTEEALRLLQDLLDQAQRRKAVADASIYVYGLAEVYVVRGEWEKARAAFADAARMSETVKDRSGVAYAEYGLAATLSELHRPADALPHVRVALRLLDDDPIQQTRAQLLEAQCLSALGQPLDAQAELLNIEKRVRATKDDSVVGEWLVKHAEVQAQLGHWREAYQALAEWRPLNARTQRQQLSVQTARLRLQFSRERDLAEVATLRRLNAQGEQLVRAQRIALALFVALLAAAFAYGVHKVRHARHLHRLAMVDELTALPNRRATLEYLDEQLRRCRQLGQPLSVLIVDVDHFKRINDQHGHAGGDEVLRAVARALAGSVRAQDRAGRLGGEEFLVVLPGTAADHARAVAERMRAGVAQLEHACTSATLRVTISIGVGVAEGAETVESLLARADQALYEAKAQGRDRVCLAAAAA